MIRHAAQLERLMQTQVPHVTLATVRDDDDFPSGIDRTTLTDFLHQHMEPYQDTPTDIRRGLDYALSHQPGQGGFVTLATVDARLAGAVVILHTGMKGYVPENLLLFAAVDSACRNLGIGGRLIRAAVECCSGDIKLHVEYDNPAKRLYERLGFTSKYAEMRYQKR